ncbi:Condensin complex subunit 3 [Lamellibrachia satsuma]|nr:Condensin complex subunit 3 [Lamellibrachia satsuma]
MLVSDRKYPMSEIMSRLAGLTDVFIESQRGLQSHGRLVKSLTKIYNKMTLEDFWEQFLHHLKYSLVIFKQEPAVERTLEFIARFVTSMIVPPVSKDGKQDGCHSDDEEEQELPAILLKLFSFLLKNHNANSRAVRYRVCQLINKLLVNMGEDAMIEDELYDSIFSCLLQRLRDKFALVRVQAVQAASRLQDPTDANCPIIKAYLFLLSCDPNADVRRAVLSCIAPCVQTLPAMLERTHDVKESVRRLAYQVLAEKVHMKALTIAQRIRLLQDGLNDRTVSVQETCSSRLVQSWLRYCAGNVLDLLTCLDVESSAETSTQAMETLFKKAPVTDLLNNFDLLTDEHVVSLDALTAEKVFYWRCLCVYVNSLGTQAEQYFEQLLPNVTAFCQYINKVFEKLKGTSDPEEQLTKDFVMQQLFKLAGILDLSDEVGRRHLGQLIYDLLVDDQVSHTLIQPLVTLYRELYLAEMAFIDQLVTVISDVRLPMSTEVKQLSQDKQRKIDIKLAGLRVQLNELREELEECVESEDFSRAAEVKGQLKEVEMNRSSLLDQSKPQVVQISTAKNDAATLLKCMTMVCEMLQGVQLHSLTPSLQTLCETLILPGMTNGDAAVRNMAVKALGLCCLLDQDTARTHLLLFMQVSQFDHETVQLTALLVIFDLLHLFGMEAFLMAGSDDATHQNENDDDASSVDRSDDAMTEIETMMSEMNTGALDDTNRRNCAQNVVSFLIGLLESESSEVRCMVAEGLAKLMLCGRVVSSKLLSRLLLLWYNPITEDDALLRHCLGAFFPIYAFASVANQEVVEEAFLPTLETLMNAPVTSPLSEVNINNVAQLLIQLTNSCHLLQCHGRSVTAVTQSCCHDSLAVRVCNEILKEPNSFNVRVLCKVLNCLEITDSNGSKLKELQVLAKSSLEEVKDRQCVKALEKFHRTVKQLLRAPGIRRSVNGGVSGDDTAQVTQSESDSGSPTRSDRGVSSTAGVRRSGRKTGKMQTMSPTCTQDGDTQDGDTSVSDAENSVFSEAPQTPAATPTPVATTRTTRATRRKTERDIDSPRVDLRSQLNSVASTPAKNKRTRKQSSRSALNSLENESA